MLAQQKLSEETEQFNVSRNALSRNVETEASLKDSRFVLLRTRPTSPISSQVITAASSPLESVDDLQSDSPTLVLKGDHHKAFRLLEDVKEFIPQILGENELLRTNLLELKSQAEIEIEAADQRTREWKISAETYKETIDTLEVMILDLRSKLQRAESVVAIERELSSKAGQEAAEAECIAKLFEDTVIQSFGIGTMFQNAISRIGMDKKLSL